MTGGIGYFYDLDGTFESKVNLDSVKIYPVSSSKAKSQLQTLLQNHADLTGSEKARTILDDFEGHLGTFKMIVPESELGILKVCDF